MSKEKPYSHLGELITGLINYISATKHWSRTQTRQYIAEKTGYDVNTTYVWTQGRQRPTLATLRTLLTIGKEDAGLDRSWGKKVLQAACYGEHKDCLNDIFGEGAIPNNLPENGQKFFVGRESELADLLKLLASDRGNITIVVNGIGGVGKTALVLEAAYYCLEVSND